MENRKVVWDIAALYHFRKSMAYIAKILCRMRRKYNLKFSKKQDIYLVIRKYIPRISISWIMTVITGLLNFTITELLIIYFHTKSEFCAFIILLRNLKVINATNYTPVSLSVNNKIPPLQRDLVFYTGFS